MTTWVDHSDKKTRFFDGGNFPGDDLSCAIESLFDYFLENILGQANATAFEFILIEVGCDTGRIILAATDRAKRPLRLSDGCSLRVQKIQDYWYDLTESGLLEKSPEQFSNSILSFTKELGFKLRQLLEQRKPELKPKSSQHGFRYLVYSSESLVYEEQFE